MSRRPWNAHQNARLSFLIGAGWPIDRIAADPAIRRSVASVRQQAHRLGLSFMEAKGIWLALPREALIAFERAGARRSLTAEGMLRLFVLTGAAHPDLIDNVVDDGAPA